MDFFISSRLENGHIIVEVTSPDAEQVVRYAYYLCERRQGAVEKRFYSEDTFCLFQLPKSGDYYVKVFARTWPNGPKGEPVTVRKLTDTISFHAPVSLSYEELEHADLCSRTGTTFNIVWNDVQFDFFIRYRPDSPQALILGTGDVGQHPRPYFSRISWAEELPYTTIYYSAPTSYREGCMLGWGYGTNDRWYLMDIAVLLCRILDNLNLKPSDTLFYGSSGGGFTSMLLASMFRSRATVINPQFMAESFNPRVVNALKAACLAESKTLLPERTAVLPTFLREN